MKRKGNWIDRFKLQVKGTDKRGLGFIADLEDLLKKGPRKIVDKKEVVVMITWRVEVNDEEYIMTYRYLVTVDNENLKWLIKKKGKKIMHGSNSGKRVDKIVGWYEGKAGMAGSLGSGVADWGCIKGVRENVRGVWRDVVKEDVGTDIMAISNRFIKNGWDRLKGSFKLNYRSKYLKDFYVGGRCWYSIVLDNLVDQWNIRWKTRDELTYESLYKEVWGVECSADSNWKMKLEDGLDWLRKVGVRFVVLNINCEIIWDSCVEGSYKQSKHWKRGCIYSLLHNNHLYPLTEKNKVVGHSLRGPFSVPSKTERVLRTQNAPEKGELRGMSSSDEDWKDCRVSKRFLGDIVYMNWEQLKEELIRLTTKKLGGKERNSTRKDTFHLVVAVDDVVDICKNIIEMGIEPQIRVNSLYKIKKLIVEVGQYCVIVVGYDFQDISVDKRQEFCNTLNKELQVVCKR